MIALLQWLALGVLIVFGVWGLYEQIKEGDEQRGRNE